FQLVFLSVRVLIGKILIQDSFCRTALFPNLNPVQDNRLQLLSRYFLFKNYFEFCISHMVLSKISTAMSHSSFLIINGGATRITFPYIPTLPSIKPSSAHLKIIFLHKSA